MSAWQCVKVQTVPCPVFFLIGPLTYFLLSSLQSPPVFSSTAKVFFLLSGPPKSDLFITFCCIFSMFGALKQKSSECVDRAESFI